MFGEEDKHAQEIEGSEENLPGDQTISTDDAPKKKDGAAQLPDPEILEGEAAEENEEQQQQRVVAEEREGPQRRGETEDDYGRRVRARINREQAVNRRLRGRIDEVETENRELRDRVANVERRQKQQDAGAETSKKISEIDAAIKAINVQLAAAIEKGDTALQLELSAKISEKTAEKAVLNDRAQRAQQEQQARQGERTDHNDPETQGTAEDRRIARNTGEWQRHNRKWWSLNKFSGMKKDAIQLDAELHSEVRNGELAMEAYSDEYFAELSARIKNLYPDLDVRGLDGESVDTDTPGDDPDEPELSTNAHAERKIQKRQPATGGVGTPGRRNGQQDPRSLALQGKVRLTRADYATMSTYGLDPNNKDHAKRFAQERMRTILSEGKPARGGAR